MDERRIRAASTPLFRPRTPSGCCCSALLVDRVGTKVGYALSIAAWSLAAIGHALVGSVGGFFGARVALGVSEGGNFPSAIKAVALWFPRRERALATALFNSGANVGAIVAPAVGAVDRADLGLARGVRGRRLRGLALAACSGSRSTTCPRRSGA